MTALIELDNLSVPKGWELRSIRELCHIQSGGTPSKSKPAFWHGDIPWVSGKDLKLPELSDSIDHISEAGLEAGSRLAPAGAVFVLVRGMGLAKDLPVAVTKRPMAFNQDIKALVSRTSLSGSFLRAAIYHAKGRLLSRIVPSAHGTMTLNLNDIENLSILVPTDPIEAEAIASVIELTQRAIAIEKQHLEIAVDFKRATMRELFSHGLRGETHREIEIGRVPVSWTVSTLGSLCDYGSGRIQTGPFGSQLHAHEYQPDGVPIVNPTHLAGNKINHEDVPKISEERAQSLSRHYLQNGDILFARRGEIGRLGLVGPREIGWLCGTGCFVVRVQREEIYNPFLAHFFATDGIVRWLEGNAAGAIMPNLNNVVLGKLPVAFPPVGEQREIVAILDAIEQKIDVSMRKSAVLKNLFNALLHKMMTGEIHVADLDLSALGGLAAVSEVAA